MTRFCSEADGDIDDAYPLCAFAATVIATSFTATVRFVQLRIAGNIRRNALARLWWWAEVTHDDERDPQDSQRYELTRQTKDRSDLILWLGDCAFSGSKPAARRLCHLQRTIKRTAHRLLCDCPSCDLGCPLPALRRQVAVT